VSFSKSKNGKKMTLHVFGNIVTHFGTAANNRAENEGSITTLQKIIWHGQSHSTVSAEAIRFALRRLLAAAEDEGTNRTWNEDQRVNEWKDKDFGAWKNGKDKAFIDDDLLGFMTANAAKEEGKAGSANVRRAVLELSRAISLTPWSGDVTFNAASPGATPSAQKKGSNPVPYGTEVHATRYQYGLALTPARLRDKSRAGKALDALCQLGTVAGNHGRFLFDFSPEAVVFRITHDPAPRLLYCFDTYDDGKTVDAPALLSKVEAGDIEPKELILGGSITNAPSGKKLRELGAFVGDPTGIKSAAAEALRRISAKPEKVK
jgi:CRISPR-associated protein Cst2